MDKKELEALVLKGLSTRKIAKEYNCSQGRVRHWLRKFGLKTRPSSGTRENPIPYKCLTCGEKNSDKFYGRVKQRCKLCTNKLKTEVDVQKKLKAIEYAGGCCIRCGYKKHYGALQFHHRDPSEKEYNWSELRGRSWENILIEIQKCDLLCANCHAEVHHEIITDKDLT